MSARRVWWRCAGCKLRTFAAASPAPTHPCGDCRKEEGGRWVSTTRWERLPAGAPTPGGILRSLDRKRGRRG